jgi:predicted dienelactone hydrolase
MRFVSRRSFLAVALIWMVASPVRAGRGADPMSIISAVGYLFAGTTGDVAGDVNADGRATAADVSGSLTGLRNPTEPGPYGVGVRRITFTKESAFFPGQPRALRTDIWYPGPPGTGPINQLPGGTPNVPLAEGLTNLPLLMFSHGSCGFPSQSIALTPMFASYGFIVAAPPHPGNTINELLTCGNAAATAQSFVERPEDIRFVIDELLRLNDDPESCMFGAIEAERIGV